MSDGGWVTVEQPGPLCTIQDLGRRSGQRLGLSPGGAMDQRSLLWANYLLGNSVRAAALEVTLGGLALRFSDGGLVALTGADCAATLDRAPVRMWRTVRVESGQTLRFGYSGSGLRAYVACTGGLSVRRAFGSASAVVRDGLPGLLGRPLRRGDRLRWHKRGQDPAVAVRRVPPGLVPQPVGDRLDLPLIPAYEWNEFSEEDRRQVFAGEWRVEAASDRTAVRLAGPPLASGPRVLDSEPLVDGTVQVTGNGLPLVFMRDRPTVGGYAKIGSVDPLALDALAQARPGTRIRFLPADPARIRRAMVRRAQFFGVE